MFLPTKKQLSYITGGLAGSCLAAAWFLPSTLDSVILGWLTALFITVCLKISEERYKPFYLIGIISNSLAFYWLHHTIRDFGGLNNFVAGLVFIFFVVVSSIQYLIVKFIYKNLPKTLHNLSLALPLAWVAGEYLSVRIFPWHLGHTQIHFQKFAQIADITGAIGISFLMIFFADCITSGRLKNILATTVIFLITLYYGERRLNFFNNLVVQEQPLAIIQGNVSLKDKHDVQNFEVNEKRYFTLSEPFEGTNRLVIWPETVILKWIPVFVGSVSNDPRLPQFKKPTPLLVGSLTAEFPDKMHNSALAILPDGTIPEPYHKRILMPFGEYIPGSSIFPKLIEFGEMFGIATFTAGKKESVFSYPLQDKKGDYELKVSPLICYEDVVSSLSRDSVKSGAQLLINITNDAWFGDSVAPFQHHLIASFRAIENRRFLVRSTNTGLTAIVNPVGETTAYLPSFKEGTLLADVGLHDEKTIYTFISGDIPWTVLSWGVLLISIVRRFRTN